jgi:chromosome segregation ATPase
METGPGWIVPGLVALAISAVALVLAAAAYLRASRSERGEDNRFEDRGVVDQLARSLREGLEESLVRIRRAQQRLGDMSVRASDTIQWSLGDLNRQLGELKRQAEQELAQVRTEVSSRALTVQEALARRIRHIEANLEVLRARDEISAAEELAADGAFLEAEQLLEDALARIREVKLRLSDVIGEDPAFAPALDALHAGLRSVRARANDHKRQLDTVLSASDSLLAWLKSREPREPVVVAVG